MSGQPSKDALERARGALGYSAEDLRCGGEFVHRQVEAVARAIDAAVAERSVRDKLVTADLRAALAEREAEVERLRKKLDDLQGTYETCHRSRVHADKCVLRLEAERDAAREQLEEMRSRKDHQMKKRLMEWASAKAAHTSGYREGVEAADEACLEVTRKYVGREAESGYLAHKAIRALLPEPAREEQRDFEGQTMTRADLCECLYVDGPHAPGVGRCPEAPAREDGEEQGAQGWVGMIGDPRASEIVFSKNWEAGMVSDEEPHASPEEGSIPDPAATPHPDPELGDNDSWVGPTPDSEPTAQGLAPLKPCPSCESEGRWRAKDLLAECPECGFVSSHYYWQSVKVLLTQADRRALAEAESTLSEYRRIMDDSADSGWMRINKKAWSAVLERRAALERVAEAAQEVLDTAMSVDGCCGWCLRIGPHADGCPAYLLEQHLAALPNDQEGSSDGE